MKENPACAWESYSCRFVLLSLFFFLQKVIYVSNWVFWSVKTEHYTIGISGPKHQERQNSQSWVHKLHWCGIIWSFAVGASLPSPCALLLLSYRLFYPELTSKSTIYPQLQCICISLSIIVSEHPRFFVSYVSCIYFLCSNVVFWTPKCSACRLEGEWCVTFWSNRFTITQIFAAVLFLQPHNESHGDSRLAVSLACRLN